MQRERGTKRKRLEEGVLKKARKYVPLKGDKDAKELAAQVAAISADLDFEANNPTTPKQKKPRKTVRGEDGVKIRVPKPVPPSEIPGETKNKKKNRNKKSKGTTETDPIPTLIETPEPETSPKKKTKKKKNKKKKNKVKPQLPEKQEKHEEDALDFMNRWKNDRNDWKFEKLKQVWLLQNALNEGAIGDEDFEVLLEYICSIKGQAREQTLKEMQGVMSKIEKNLEVRGHEANVRYERSRRIVQMLAYD